MSVSKENCLDNIDKIIQILDDFGFVIHTEKSNFQPNQIMEFLGFVIDSATIRIHMTERKKVSIMNLYRATLDRITC